MIKAIIFIAIASALCILIMAALSLISRIKPEIMDFILFADLIIKRRRSHKNGNNKVVNINNYKHKQSAESYRKIA